MRRLILLILTLVSGSLLFAQTDRATLTGIVMDPGKSVVVGASVALQSNLPELYRLHQPILPASIPSALCR